MVKRKRHLNREGKSGDQKTKDAPHVTTIVQHDDPVAAPVDIPLRDNFQLYAAPETIACARKCVPCAYKIGLFDVALDTDFCKQVPNQRPEQCPRLVAMDKPRHNTEGPSTNTMGYRPGMSVLCVGDGDFSFSLAVARILFASTPCTSRLIATSYESEETLREVYPNFGETHSELCRLGVTIKYRVDATKLAETLSDGSDEADLQFDRICWNFPCSAIEKGQDGQNDEMEHNKELVRAFVASAAPYTNGEIQICHKTKPPFNQWKLEHVVAEGSPEVRYAGRIVLDRALLPPYIPRKALDRKSFPCHDACIYIFQRTSTPEARFPATIENTGSDAPQPVTKDLLLSLRFRIMRFTTSKPKQKGSSRYGRSSKRFKR
jgi:25S rRNA (uracil2634-N3)-methyltransferase